MSDTKCYLIINTKVMHKLHTYTKHCPNSKGKCTISQATLPPSLSPLNVSSYSSALTGGGGGEAAGAGGEGGGQ